MEEMRWDLTKLVRSTEQKEIMDQLDEMVQDAKAFAAKYRGRISGSSPSQLAELLAEKDAMFVRHEGPMMYCQLIFAGNTNDPMASAFSDAMVRAGTESGKHLAFLDIELGEKMLSQPSLALDPALSSYRHYLERVIQGAPHNLTEIEEKLILAKDQYGIIKWSKLQQRWLSSRTFRMNIDGEEKDLSLGEMMAFVTDPDRERRLHAYQVLGKVIAESDTIWVDALSSICGDHLEMCQWRRYPTPMSSSLLFNDVGEKAIRTMMRVVEKHVPMCKEYYDLKAKLLSLERCGDWDMLAPLGTKGRKYTWEESRERMISAYSRFDPSWGRWVGSMFTDRRIDSEVRKGKRNGAFCSDWYAGKGAFILMSFNGNINDLYTEAHELGHSVHAHLSIERQNPSNCQVSFCVAECGSIFGELLLTDLLLQEAKNDEDRQVALASVLDTFAYILFHVGARYVFEDAIYQTLQAGDNLDAEKTCRMWTSARSRMMDDSMTWLPESDWTWARVPHYFRSGLRFYNYPYIFAQLFVFSLYRLYKEQGKEFVPKMNALLAQGSSLSADDLAKQLGFDLENEDFWEKGIIQAEEFLQQLKATMK